MAKKKKTLPKNYKELIEEKDLAALKAMYDLCEIDAYNNGSDKKKPPCIQMMSLMNLCGGWRGRARTLTRIVIQ
ncbi:hypothetical protein ACYULU_04675 [Breznakiellaceae bacterium SP9]